MVVLVAQATFHLGYCQSLKDKRQIRRKLLDGLRARFSAAVAEVADQDRPKLLSVAWVLVGQDAAVLRPVLDRALDWAVSVAGDPVALSIDVR